MNTNKINQQSDLVKSTSSNNSPLVLKALAVILLGFDSF